MFVWNPSNVLIAIDAGIPEVIRTFNRAHLQAQVNGVGLHGPRAALTPIHNPRLAFAVAMDTTVCILNLIEARPHNLDNNTDADFRFVDALGFPEVSEELGI